MFIRSLTLAALLAVTPALAEEGGHVENIDFSFDGPFGTYDRDQLQRGLQVYVDVCSGCHGLRYVPLRALTDLGYSEKEVTAFAEATYTVTDKITGEERPAKYTDYFPKSGVETAPDLSLMAKARAGFHGPYGLGINQLVKGMGGPEYIVSILTGFEDAPACAANAKMDGLYYNKNFPGGGYPDECKIYEEVTTEKVLADGTTKTVVDRKEVGRMAPGSWIAMSPPLEDGTVTYADGHPNDRHHLAEDVAAFLMWTAEPHLEARKHAGFLGVVVLTILAALFYLTNKRIWAGVKGRKQS